jgi:hypothetical protein
MLFSSLTRWLQERRQTERRRPSRPRRRFPLPGEALKVRQILSAQVVMTTLDNGSNTLPTPGSLRQAILHADTLGKAGDQIKFNIPTSDPGYSSTTGALPSSRRSRCPMSACR